MKNQKVGMKYLFAFVSPMRRVWHRTGTQEMLEQEGSKGRDEDNGPRTRELFASFNNIRGRFKEVPATDDSLHFIAPPWASIFLYTKCVWGARRTERMLD